MKGMYFFFDKLKDTLEYIGVGYRTIMEGDDNQSEINYNVDGLNSMLYGSVKKMINTNRCEDGVFPYKILSKCTKLIEVSGLFNGLQGDSSLIYDLPKDIFINNTKLTNVSGFFSNLKLNYRLTGDSFINNKIINFNSVFSDSGKLGKCGPIPYHLFYQKAGNIITKLNNALSCGVLMNLEHYTCTDSVYENHLTYVDDNGLITINPYIFDGTVEFYDKYIKGTIIEDIYNLYDCIDNGKEIPENLTKYVDENNQPLYNPLHNVYKDIILNVDTYRDLKNLIRKDSFSDDYTYEEAKKYNYLCPPDVFNYCNNISTLNINNFFSCRTSNSSEVVQGLTGYRGRIPDHIFDKITNIKILSGVFRGCQNIMPHKNGYTQVVMEDNGETTKTIYYAGIMYPRGLFSKLLNLTTLSSVFEYHNIWGLCVLESDMFGEIGKNVTSLSGLFSNTTFINKNTEINQIENGLFDNFGVLKDISDLFSLSSNVPLFKSIFTSTIHPWLTNVSNFLNNTRLRNEIEVPEFWNWTYPPESVQGCYEGVSPTPLNEASIPIFYKKDLEN
jgi:hypothetical protein